MGIKILDEFGYRVRRGQPQAIAIERILEELGWTVVGRLIRAARGQPITIPSDPSLIAPAVGRALAEKLVARYAGRHCQIPADGAALLEQRDKAMRTEAQAGATRAALMEKYRVNQHELDVALRHVEG